MYCRWYIASPMDPMGMDVRWHSPRKGAMNRAIGVSKVPNHNRSDLELPPVFEYILV